MDLWNSATDRPDAARHTLLCERLDGAGNRGSGNGLQQAQVRTYAGLGPALAVSRLSRTTRRSHGSLPQRISRRSWR